MRDVFIITIIMVALSISAVIGVKSLTIPSKFSNGQIVNMVAFNKRGMIIRSRCLRSCNYVVRFLATQSTTNTHLIASDDAISVAPISLVYNIQEFEIEAVD